LLVASGVFYKVKVAVDLRLVRDLRDLQEIFGEPLAAIIGAMTAAIGFFFADRRASWTEGPLSE
jgi:hypothetical protein